MAVVATLSKGYDLDYIWKQVDRGPAKDAAGYYIQASESGGEPPGRWWGPGARSARASSRARWSSASRMTCCSASAKPRTAPRWAGPPAAAGKPRTSTQRLLAAEPHATAERRHELRVEAARQARQSPLFFDLTISLSKSISIFHASLGENARLARQAGDRDGDRYWSALVGEVDDMIWQAVRAGFGYFQREAGLHPHRVAQHAGPRPGDRPVARGRPGGGALAAAHLPGRRHAAARPLPDRPRRQDRSPTGSGGPRIPWATTSTSARWPRSCPSTWRRR